MRAVDNQRFKLYNYPTNRAKIEYSIHLFSG